MKRWTCSYHKLVAINSMQFNCICTLRSCVKFSIRSHGDTETESKFECGNHFALRNMHTQKSKKKTKNRNFGWELITRRSGNKLSQLLEQPKNLAQFSVAVFSCWCCRSIHRDLREEAIELGQWRNGFEHQQTPNRADCYCNARWQCNFSLMI